MWLYYLIILSGRLSLTVTILSHWSFILLPLLVCHLSKNRLSGKFLLVCNIKQTCYLRVKWYFSNREERRKKKKKKRKRVVEIDGRAWNEEEGEGEGEGTMWPFAKTMILWDQPTQPDWQMLVVYSNSEIPPLRQY